MIKKNVVVCATLAVLACGRDENPLPPPPYPALGGTYTIEIAFEGSQLSGILRREPSRSCNRAGMTAR
jgi:hypothetical protein